MLQSVSGVGVDAARVARDTPVHQLSLCFERERFRVRRQDPPWKVVRAFPLPGCGALVHLHNVSGGVLAGDRLALDVEVEAGAAAQITTTGATRLYRHRAGAADSEQRARFSVGDAALLEYLPDAVIPYAGSRHLQRTEIRLGRGCDSVLVGSSRPRQAGRGRAFRVRAAARRNRSLRRAAAGPAGRFSSGARAERPVRDGTDVRILAHRQPVRGSGRAAARVLASAGGPIERNRSRTNTAWASRLGREHAGFGWRGRAGFEHERMFHP